MGPELQLVLAVVLDLLLGDPRWVPHPVRGMGWLAVKAESVLRNLTLREEVAGASAALLVVAASVASAYGLIRVAALISPFAAETVGLVLIYTTVAARDLSRHAGEVARALGDGDLEEARRRTGMIVGRDTDQLDEAGVIRAAVESVAESIVDGVTAPVFFAAVFGPLGAVAYRAVNTLDSMFGYRNERYLHFGWASARLDDLANYIPARMTGPLICVAAFILRNSGRDAIRILFRDALNHPSPNAGLAEAAVAGALGVQLGGTSTYAGLRVLKPTIGDARVALGRAHIRAAVALMYLGSGLFLLSCLLAREVAIWLF